LLPPFLQDNIANLFRRYYLHICTAETVKKGIPNKKTQKKQ